MPRNATRAPATKWSLRARFFFFVSLIALWAAASIWLANDALLGHVADVTDLREQLVLAAGVDVLILLCALALVALVLVRDVLGPVRTLVDAVDGMAQGDYQLRVPSSEIREFDELAGTVNQLAEQLNTQLSQLSQRAFHDPLTALPNRHLFVDRLKGAVARARRRGSLVAVVYIDLDDFKQVNDTLGHDGGDELLLGFAARLKHSLRSEDTAARLGGDEFTVLIDGVPSAADAVRAVERIMREIGQPMTIKGQHVTPGASVGVAFSDAGRVDPDDLLRNADAAMYQSKGSGKGRYTLYDPPPSESGRLGSSSLGGGPSGTVSYSALMSRSPSLN